jgi:TonB family protein
VRIPFMSSSSFHSRSVSLPIAIILVAFIAHLPHAAPAEAEDLPALLERPMTPGSVALLVEHVTQPAAQKRLAEAIKHEDPAVRAVAARIAFVTQSRGLVSGLITAMAKEEHVPAAVEQIRALLGIVGQAGDNVAMRHVQRVGGPAAVAMAESLARTRPRDLVTHLPALLAAGGEPDALGGPIAAAVIQHPSAANEILQAVLATKNVALWDSILGTTRNNTDIALSSAVLVQALQSSEEYQRVEVVWHLFETIHGGDEAPEDALAAAAPRPAAATAAAGDLTWEDFSREMLARARKVPPTKADWAGLMALETHRERVRALSHGVYAYLTPGELKAIGAVRGFDNAAESQRFERTRRRANTEGQTRTQVMRTIPVFAKGLLGDLLKVTGCRPPNERHFAAGEVTYRPEGGPQHISIINTTQSKDCAAFVSAMMKLTIALGERPITPDSADHIVLLFNRQYLACADDPFPPVRPRFGPHSTLVRPKRIKQADIQYPQAALRADVDGAVVLGVRISHTGCVGSAETLRSINPLLDLAAIQGVFTAQYAPATLDGQPIETHMTYTVNFRR